MSAPQFHVPLIIRGRIIEDRDLKFGGRGGGVAFTTADVRKHIDALSLALPSQMAELHSLPFESILDYLDELGGRLALRSNVHLQEALALSKLTSGLGEGILEHFYSTLGASYRREIVREHAENTIGVRYLDGWVPRRMASGCLANIRAFGVRSVHVLAGNVPMPSALGVIRNAITRSDAIFKTPSNDPITAAAIARTMIEMAPEHPITRHLSVAYWKGGDVDVESALYRPDRIEKIVAWGGAASMKHITQYIQPGIDLVAMDPKLSSAIIGSEAFADEATLREVAQRLAIDVGYLNQQACASARVVYVQSGTSEQGVDAANALGKLLFEALQALPAGSSSAAPRMNPQLAEELQSLRLMSDEHKVYGGGREGGVVVSQTPQPVDFAALLTDRVVNLVPFDDLETPIRSVNSYTQTIGIFPDELKAKIRDRLVFNGAQRLTSLGYMLKAAMAGPHDGIEPVRRMCKWIVDETSDPRQVASLTTPGV